MKIFLLSLVLALGFQARAEPWATTRPRLFVVLVIDQFRADYLSRFQAEFRPDGFKALMKTGAYFPYGEYDILQCMTGPGHATILTGAYPYQMGIALNEWYDQSTHKPTYCVQDDKYKLFSDRSAPGISPRWLVGTTVGDELKNSGAKSKVIALALKDRAAVLLGGKRADLAFWYDNKSARWTTSEYYHQEPSWLAPLNAQLKPCNLEQPCGAEMTVAAFKAALHGAALGRGPDPDLIAVSFSSHYFAGHHFGPNSEAMHQMTLADDRAVADIRRAVAAEVPGGLSRVVFVLTGDHGVAPSPEYLKDTGVEAGHIDEKSLVTEIESALKTRFGSAKQGPWIAFCEDFNFFVDEASLQAAKVNMREVQAEIKDVLASKPFFAHVIAQTDIADGHIPPGQFARQIGHTYFRGRSGHVIAIPRPFFINAAKNSASHMTGYAYDRMVPILFSGYGVRSGLFADPTEVVDIAPTLSFMAGVLPPALSEGHVLRQALSAVRSKP